MYFFEVHFFSHSLAAVASAQSEARTTGDFPRYSSILEPSVHNAQCSFLERAHKAH